MIPVDQTKLHDAEKGTRGNCLRASIASLLELGIEEMPHFEDLGFFGEAFLTWCASRNLEHVFIEPPQAAPSGYSIAIGPPNRECPPDMTHAVIAKDGQPVFDPHPSRAGLSSIKYYLTFEPV